MPQDYCVKSFTFRFCLKTSYSVFLFSDYVSHRLCQYSCKFKNVFIFISGKWRLRQSEAAEYESELGKVYHSL
jgi:hypothetical protein